MGNNARKNKYKVLGHVIKKRLSFDTYLITLPSNTSNILLQSHYKKKYITEDIYVIGIAEGKKEALELVRDIIDEVYSNTGGFNISQYLRFGCKR